MSLDNNNIVVFKGNEKGIIVIVDDKADYDEIKDVLTKKAENVKMFFKGGATSVTFKGKPLMSDEQQELLDIISEKAGLKVSFLDKNKVVPQVAEVKEISKEEKKAEKEEEKLTNLIIGTKNITEYHIGSLRSGQSITYNGSVVVVGDVNPGAEIKAEGNIIVLGKLKGIVHAGSKGDKTAFVAAIYMKPTQLIISDVMTAFPDDGREMVPEYAYVKDEKIYVEVL